MSRIRPPENIEIASLKKKQEMGFDAMAPGPGTPWEDRGTHGTVKAFFKTCWASLFSPAALTDSIRRPETTGDAKGFVIGCAILWGLSAVIHMLLLIPHWTNTPNIDYFDGQTYGIYCAIAFAAAAVGTVVLFNFFNSMYGKLVAQEKSSSLLPDVLLYNVNAYGLGPSLLALIPFIGPPIALLWIFIDLVINGKKRLNLRAAGALIDALLPFIAVLVVGAAMYFVGNWIVHQVLGDAVVLRQVFEAPGHH
jgi:hypothetical protein